MNEKELLNINRYIEGLKSILESLEDFIENNKDAIKIYKRKDSIKCIKMMIDLEIYKKEKEIKKGDKTFIYR